MNKRRFAEQKLNNQTFNWHSISTARWGGEGIMDGLEEPCWHQFRVHLTSPRWGAGVLKRTWAQGGEDARDLSPDNRNGNLDGSLLAPITG